MSATDHRPTTDQNRNLRYRSETIPADLVALGGWVATGDDKIPHHPGTLRRADPSDPTSGGTFAQAVATAARPGFGRIGLILDPATAIVAFDWDGCVDPETGAIDPAVLADLAELNTYAEYSPSRTGVRAFAFGSLPPGARRRGKVEAYDRDRYMSVTGWSLPGYDALAERTDQIAALHRRRLAGPAKPSPNPAPVVSLARSDQDVIDRAGRSDKFRRLYLGGDMSDYGDDWSRADLAELDFLIAAGADGAAQLDRLHRAGPLHRDKWDQRRGPLTYGEKTLARALDGTVTPTRPRLAVPKLTPPSPAATDTASCGVTPDSGAGDSAGSPLPDDVPGLKAVIADLTRRLATAEERAAVADERATAAEARADMLAQVQSKATGIIANGKLRSARNSGLTLSYLFASREAAGADGPIAINQRAMAERAGCSDDAFAKHLDLFAAEGVIRRTSQWVPGEFVDKNGAVRPGRLQTYIEPVGSAVDFTNKLVALDPIRVKRDGSADRGWGGARACRDHPDAEVVVASEASCGVCGKRLGTLKTVRHPSLAAAAEALEVDLASPNPAPIPHDADPTPSVVNHMSRNLRDYHNDAQHGPPRQLAPDAADRAAAARADLITRRQSAGEPERLLAPPGPVAVPAEPAWFTDVPPTAPPDRYTDISSGARP